ALDPVVGRAVAVAGQGFLVLGFGAVQLGTFPHDLLDAEDLRAVRILLTLALGVVLAVDGRPGLGGHAGGQPQPEAGEVGDGGVQVQRTVCRVPVQVDGDAGNGDVRQHQPDKNGLPPAGAGQPLVQKVDQVVPQSG